MTDELKLKIFGKNNRKWLVDLDHILSIHEDKIRHLICTKVIECEKDLYDMHAKEERQNRRFNSK